MAINPLPIGYLQLPLSLPASMFLALGIKLAHVSLVAQVNRDLKKMSKPNHALVRTVRLRRPAAQLAR